MRLGVSLAQVGCGWGRACWWRRGIAPSSWPGPRPHSTCSATGGSRLAWGPAVHAPMAWLAAPHSGAGRGPRRAGGGVGRRPGVARQPPPADRLLVDGVRAGAEAPSPGPPGRPHRRRPEPGGSPRRRLEPRQRPDRSAGPAVGGRARSGRLPWAQSDALQLVVRADIVLTDRPVEGHRAPYAGSIEQVVCDSDATRRAGAHEVILGLSRDHGLNEALEHYAAVAEALDVTAAA